MTAEIDHTLYSLFERIVREARDADVYEVRLTAKRLDGSSYTYGQPLNNTEKQRVPWGTLGGISHVEWYPGGTWQSWRPLEGDKRHVRISYHGYYHGIIVHTGLHEHSDPLDKYMNGEIKCFIFGVAGAIKPLGDCVALPDEDAVVARVLEVIEKAYEVIAGERNEPYDEDDCSDDVYDRLERQAYQRLYGEPAEW